MITPPLPADEKGRLQELYSLELLDTPYEAEFDEIVRVASKICDTPISTVSLIDSHRQWFKAKLGLADSETSRDLAFCGHAILDDKLMEVPNALDDERFFDNPLVTDNPNIRFYAGMPLVTQRGFKIGTLCVIDTIPRNLDAEQLQSLETLAKQVTRIIELRVKVKELNTLTDVKNRIISIIGHDVRNPLSGIKGILEVKSMGLLSPEEESKVFSMLSDQVEQTLGLLTNLAEWGKLDLMPKKAEINELQINGLVDTCVEGLAINIAAKNNEVKNNTTDVMHLPIDKNSLLFILRNLITNANKFTENGLITVSNHANNITVCDTGKGMTAKQIETLLGTNHYDSTTGTHNEGGTGLGLMLIKDFLRKIDGRLAVESSPGKGTCVSIIFK
jgi:signal transduction histidine kinase